MKKRAKTATLAQFVLLELFQTNTGANMSITLFQQIQNKCK